MPPLAPRRRVGSPLDLANGMRPASSLRTPAWLAVLPWEISLCPTTNRWPGPDWPPVPSFGVVPGSLDEEFVKESWERSGRIRMRRRSSRGALGGHCSLPVPAVCCSARRGGWNRYFRPYSPGWSAHRCGCAVRIGSSLLYFILDAETTKVVRPVSLPRLGQVARSRNSRTRTDARPSRAR